MDVAKKTRKLKDLSVRYQELNEACLADNKGHKPYLVLQQIVETLLRWEAIVNQ